MSDEDDYGKFVQPRAEEELHQSELSPVAMGTSPEDGLPMQTAPRNLDKSPPLSPDTLICMEDRRSFVVRDEFTGAVLRSWEPSAVTRFPNGVYAVKFPDLQPAIEEWWSQGVYSEQKGWVIVEPVRPACAHYLRMQTDLAADRDARYLQRACTIQRGEDGEYYSVRDTMVTACNLRSPRHYETEIAILDAFDESKMAQAAAAKEQEAFSVEAELEREKQSGSGLGVLG